jgi:hypothetical protein
MATEKEVLMNLDSDDVIDRVAGKRKLLVNCMTVRHVFSMERLTLMIYSFFMHWGCVSICPCFGAVV